MTTNVCNQWLTLFGFAALLLFMMACSRDEAADESADGDMADSAERCDSESGEERESGESEQDAPFAFDYPYEAQTTCVRFSPSEMENDFFAVPFPHDLFLDASGSPNLAAFPNPNGSNMMEDLRDMATYRRKGFHQTPVCTFVFTGGLDIEPIPSDPYAFEKNSAPFYLVGLDESSPDYAKRYPLVWHYWQEADNYQPGRLLSFMPMPGYPLRPNTAYACVVNDALRDEHGQPLGQSESFWRVMTNNPAENAESKAVFLHAKLAEYFHAESISPSVVAGASVFTTGHSVKQFKALYDDCTTRQKARIASSYRQTREYERFRVLATKATLPIFREGEKPYNEGGRFRFDQNGKAVKTREEKAPLVLTIPTTPMPEDGYPLVIYVHGSNGLSTQAVDRGKTTQPDGLPAEGEGAAYILAREGIATAAMALPMNPERYPEGGRDAYQNLGNFPSIIGHYHQAVIELGLLLDALQALSIDPETIEGFTGQENEIHFDFSKGALAMGQSQGGMTLSLFAAVEPDLAAIAPSGVGGIYTLIFFLVDNPPVGTLLNAALGVGNADLNELHPILTLAQMGLEAIDPAVSVRHIVKEPLDGTSAKDVFYPAGYIDTAFPPASIQAWVLGLEASLAGEQVYAPLFEHAEHKGLTLLDYPAGANLSTPNGEKTAVVVQYEEDGIKSGHHINFQLDEPKFQYRCFFKSYLETGVAKVFRPSEPLGDCPQMR